MTPTEVAAAFPPIPDEVCDRVVALLTIERVAA